MTFNSAALTLALLLCCAAAAFWLLRRRRPARRAAPERSLRPILVDGSNVLFWHKDRAELASLRRVVLSLQSLGYAPHVICDASIGYRVSRAWMSAEDLSAAIALPAAQITVAPKGVTADELLLARARSSGEQIVTNDRYRDWQAAFPVLRRRGDLLVRGSISAGRVRLNLRQPRKRR